MINHIPQLYLSLLRLISALVPSPVRDDWRREWEAEVFARWLQLTEWGQLNLRNKLELTGRIAGATRDAVSFQPPLSSLALLNILVALLVGFGAAQSFEIRSLRDGTWQMFVVSSVGIIVSLLFIASAVAMFRRWQNGRGLIVVTGVLSILLHVYGALPPHRTIGYLAVLVGAGYGLLMLVAFERQRRNNLIA
ncbi:MAG TPA: hypothetical protein VKD91_18170 [Pyrinomonadaceae bacterium]|nr:hypothetical protein [Pyrinomonadaceae bacterium]